MAGTYRMIPMGLSDGGWSPSELSHGKHARATEGLSRAWGGRHTLINVWSMKNKKRGYAHNFGQMVNVNRWQRESSTIFIFATFFNTVPQDWG